MRCVARTNLLWNFYNHTVLMMMMMGCVMLLISFVLYFLRRAICKYRHITKEEEEIEIMEFIRNNTIHRNKFNDVQETCVGHVNVGNVTRLSSCNFEDSEFGPTLAKRRYYGIHDFGDSGFISELNRKPTPFRGYFAGNAPPMLGQLDARYVMLSIIRSDEI